MVFSINECDEPALVAMLGQFLLCFFLYLLHVYSWPRHVHVRVHPVSSKTCVYPNPAWQHTPLPGGSFNLCPHSSPLRSIHTCAFYVIAHTSVSLHHVTARPCCGCLRVQFAVQNPGVFFPSCVFSFPF